MGQFVRRFLRSSARGQAIVEMALITPLLLMLMGGTIDFGLYMYKEVQAANCVREVARKAALRGTALPGATATPTEISEFARYCGAFTSAMITVTPTDYLTQPTGAAVVARIDQPHTWLIIGPLMSSLQMIPNFPQSPRIQAEAAMRLEGQQV